MWHDPKSPDEAQVCHWQSGEQLYRYHNLLLHVVYNCFVFRHFYFIPLIKTNPFLFVYWSSTIFVGTGTLFWCCVFGFNIQFVKRLSITSHGWISFDSIFSLGKLYKHFNNVCFVWFEVEVMYIFQRVTKWNISVEIYTQVFL